MEPPIFQGRRPRKVFGEEMGQGGDVIEVRRDEKAIPKQCLGQ
jgi:hypothetical protein